MAYNGDELSIGLPEFCLRYMLFFSVVGHLVFEVLHICNWKATDIRLQIPGLFVPKN